MGRCIECNSRGLARSNTLALEAALAGSNVGEKVKVRYMEGRPPVESKYTLDVEVMAICSSHEFKGRIERVFAANGLGAPGEITGGDLLKLKGQEKTFKVADIRYFD
jgi:hypothetical protein